MSNRGFAAFKEQQKAAQDRKVGGFANALFLKPDESVVVRFRGLLTEPAVKYTEDELKKLSADDLAAHIKSLAVATFDNPADQVKAILDRYNQVEPFVYKRHYIARNRGKDAYATCAAGWDPSGDCAYCYAQSTGDKGVSTQTQVVFSVVPQRSYYSWEEKGEKHFQYATADDKPPRPGLELKPEGIKYLGFSQTHAAGLFAAAERIAGICAECGIGKIKSGGLVCANSECEAPFGDDWADCADCGTVARKELLACSKKCLNPRRAQLHDIDILVQRIGEQKKTVYQFIEQLPAEPLTDTQLAYRLPVYEIAFKPQDVATQVSKLGLTRNPFAANKPTPSKSPVTTYADDDLDDLDPFRGEE